jgi:type III restriction enzyme
MFREIGNPIFKTQVIGRIRRMPEAVHYQSAILNNGYVFTNYDKNKIEAGYAIDKNKPKIFKSTRKPEIDTLLLDSEYVSRTDYNTLVSTEDK